MNRLVFSEALKLLAEQAGIALSHYHKKNNAKGEFDLLYALNEWVQKTYSSQLNQEETQNYLKNRDIQPKTQKEFSLGFAASKFRFLEFSLENDSSLPDKKKALQNLHDLGLIVKNTRGEDSSYNRFRNRLIFPIHDEMGKVIGFGGRIIEDKADTAKYVNSPESKLFHKKRSLYSLHRAKASIRENNLAVLVEGYFDVIGLYQKGVRNAVAPLGTSFTQEQAKLIKRFSDHLVIFFDSDSAGCEAAMKALITAKKLKIHTKVVHSPDQNQDPYDIAKEKDEIDLLAMIDSAKDEMSFVLWYYFSHKHSLNDLEDKKTAISDFFSYVKENVEQLWEQLEFMDGASPILGISPQTLQYDFKKDLKNSLKNHTRTLSPVNQMGRRGKQAQSAATGMKKIPTVEKDILAVLLYFPDYWEKEFLLDQVNWSSREMYLLFGFFRDRLKSGEIWKWENLNEVISLLPQELAAVLSEIIF